MLDAAFPVQGTRSFHVEALSSGVALDCAELRRRIDSAAIYLREHGVKSGDRVLFCGDQGVAALVAFWAAVANGAAFVPVDMAWPLPLCRRVLSRITPRLGIIDSAGADSPWHALSDSVRLARIDADGRFERAAGALMAASNPGFQPVEMPGDAPAACLFTSGSTADPKVVVLSRDALLRSGQLVVDTFGWRAGERLLNLPDPHTMSGLRNAFIAAPLAGMHIVFAPRAMRRDIFALLGTLERAAAQRIVAAPLLLRQINLLGDRVPYALFAPTRAIYCTGADLNTAEVKAFHERFRIPVINYYGLTETVGLCLSQRLDGWRPDDASIGWPVGCEIRIVDEQGVEVPGGSDGELEVRQVLGMSGYLGDPEATAAIRPNGWLRTGDVVRRRADGSIVISGRRATFIKVPTTEKVHPQEIEAVLEEHGLVAEAAVCGLPDASGGERIAALLVARNPRLEAGATGDVAQFVLERLGAARAPKVIRWVSSLPRGANGKIARANLGERFND